MGKRPAYVRCKLIINSGRISEIGGAVIFGKLLRSLELRISLGCTDESVPRNIALIVFKRRNRTVRDADGMELRLFGCKAAA